jgi:hypothetical protein
MADVKSLIVAALYGSIREMADKFIGGLGGVAGVSLTDLVLFAIGYWKKNTWWGEGLMYGAVVQLGGNLIRLSGAKATAQAQAPAVATTKFAGRAIIV